MIDSFYLSEKSCEHCGWRHQLDAFKVGDFVSVTPNYDTEHYWGASGVWQPGTIGMVVQWSQYGGPVYVRVEPINQLGLMGVDCRANFSPCELEHL